MTVVRLAALPESAPPVIVAGEKHIGMIQRQLRDLNQRGLLLAEPEARDSAPAIIAAALLIARMDPTAMALMVASDHHIPDISAFSRGVAQAFEAAEAGHIITFGIQPDGPSAAYGYIRPGGPITPGSAVRTVAGFHEKPSLDRARTLIEGGGLWNSGNFLFRVDIMLAEAARLCPALVESVGIAMADGVRDGDTLTLGPAFRDCQKISIDFAVMEKTNRAAVIPVHYSWSDLGAWDSIWAASPKDSAGNAVKGRVAAVSTQNALLHAEPGVEIVALGLTDVAVIAQDHRVLVCSLDKAPEIKTALEVLARLPPSAPKTAVPLSQTREKLTFWLFNEAFPTWWCFGADHVGGGFHDRLGWDLTPMDHARRLKVQARQVFVYATAGVMGWTGPWATAVRHGLDWLEARHRRPDGLFRTLVAQDGAVLDNAANLYDQAFVLLALATAAKALPNEKSALSAMAHDLADRVAAVFAQDQGGFCADESGMRFEADPIMHLFEASQAWLDVEPSPVFQGLADGIATHFMDRMMDRDQPRIREVFAPDWSPAPGEPGRRVWPGHQFEWAWLLDRWGTRSGDDRARLIAAGLYLTGKRGIDPTTNFVLHELLDDDTPTTRNGRIWSQAERLRAALMLETDPAARVETAAAAAAALKAYFTASPAGLWRDGRPDLGIAEDAALASSLYHIVGAILALHNDAALEAL
jgi:mannose/cellobiose epimerase-like protein (N-acyl-D-glucosamine 2-epimerase family)/mannose-1-phosphate guanylyltransferase